MRVLFVTHAEFEKPGYFETWAKQNGYDIAEVKPYAGEKLPDVDSFDFLIIMGGPQSPLEIEDAPYLSDEIKLIKEVIKANKPIVGICLGAQLIGEALGAKTERSPNKEIGAYPITLHHAAKEDPIFKNFTRKFNVMHWHNDMPGLAEGADLLAFSEGCPRQILRYSEKVYGFQCHFELTKELVKVMIEKCPNDLKPGKYINTIEELMTVDYAEINAKLDTFLNHLINVQQITDEDEKISYLRFN